MPAPSEPRPFAVDVPDEVLDDLAADIQAFFRHLR